MRALRRREHERALEEAERQRRRRRQQEEEQHARAKELEEIACLAVEVKEKLEQQLADATEENASLRQQLASLTHQMAALEKAVNEARHEADIERANAARLAFSPAVRVSDPAPALRAPLRAPVGTPLATPMFAFGALAQATDSFRLARRSGSGGRVAAGLVLALALGLGVGYWSVTALPAPVASAVTASDAPSLEDSILGPVTPAAPFTAVVEEPAAPARTVHVLASFGPLDASFAPPAAAAAPVARVAKPAVARPVARVRVDRDPEVRRAPARPSRPALTEPHCNDDDPLCGLGR